jgi:hypothetical protein
VGALVTKRVLAWEFVDLIWESLREGNEETAPRIKWLVKTFMSYAKRKLPRRRVQDAKKILFSSRFPANELKTIRSFGIYGDFLTCLGYHLDEVIVIWFQIMLL